MSYRPVVSLKKMSTNGNIFLLKMRVKWLKLLKLIRYNKRAPSGSWTQLNHYAPCLSNEDFAPWHQYRDIQVNCCFVACLQRVKETRGTTSTDTLSRSVQSMKRDAEGVPDYMLSVQIEGRMSTIKSCLLLWQHRKDNILGENRKTPHLPSF